MTTHRGLALCHAALICILLSEPAGAETRPALFGSHEVRSSSLEPFPKWLGILRRCEGLEGLFGLLPDDLKARLAPVRGRPLIDRMRFTNRLVNQYAYRSDEQNWGERDRWSPPGEFLLHGGDCEDFAVTKYIALRYLGVAAADLRIVVVQDTELDIKHAVVAVYQNDLIWILDNQVADIRRSTEVLRYRPIYSINEHHWWKHEMPPD